MGSRYFVHDITDTLKIVCVMIFYTVRHFYFLNAGDAKRSVWPITNAILTTLGCDDDDQVGRRS